MLNRIPQFRFKVHPLRQLSSVKGASEGLNTGFEGLFSTDHLDTRRPPTVDYAQIIWRFAHSPQQVPQFPVCKLDWYVQTLQSPSVRSMR